MLTINTPSTEINEYHISQKSVKAALHSLLYSSSIYEPNPLENILLVRQLAADPVMPQGPHSGSHALHLLLTSTIAEELVKHRRALSIPVGNEQTLIEARNAIGQDTRTSKQELISWSWLYYHYVRMEFNISAKEYSQIAFINDRTLRRYRGHGVWRLTQHLIVKEKSVREKVLNNIGSG